MLADIVAGVLFIITKDNQTTDLRPFLDRIRAYLSRLFVLFLLVA